MAEPELPEPFELHGARPVAAELPSRAWMALRKHHDKLEETARRERAMLLESAARLSRTAEAAACALGLLSHEIGRSHRRGGDAGSDELRHLSIKAVDALRTGGVELDDPAGRPLTGSVLERCQVIENLPRADVREHVVGETITPAILLGPKVIHLAEVIGWIPQSDAVDH